MRRNDYFYPAIMFPTFIVGVIASLCFQWLVSSPAKFERAATMRMQKSVASFDVALKCSDGVLQELWKKLVREESFKGLSISDCSEHFRLDEFDLNRDGKSETVVHGSGLHLCSATGNCPFWIYSESEDGYKLLLEADNIQQYEFKGSSTGGYRELITRTHDSAYDSQWSLYKYDGDQYRLKECTLHSYSFIDEKGRFRERKRPQVTVVNCH